VRTALEKFRDRGIEAGEALELLVQDHLLLHFDEDVALKDQVFVEKEVLNKDVNEILYLNKTTLKRLHSKHSTFEIADAQKLMEPMYPHSEMQIRQQFNRSKMTMFIPTNVGEGRQAEQLDFSEFIVFLCAVAKNLIP